MQRRDIAGSKCELLLATLLHGEIRSINFSESHWVLKSENFEGQTHLSCEYRQQGYYFEGMGVDADDYTKPASIMREADPAEYYNRIGYSFGEPFTPSNLNKLIDSFFLLSPEDEERFWRAAYWFQHAQRVRWLSHSAFFTALISAVEAVMSGQGKNPSVCPCCKRELAGGPTGRFSEFVDSLASNVSKAERRRFYAIRSKLSHGSGLLFRDRGHAAFAFTAEENQDQFDLGAVEHLVRLVLVNWLIKPDLVPNSTPFSR